MKTFWLGMLSGWGLGFLLCSTPAAAAEPDNIEVLARGPVHEGFAGPSDQMPQRASVLPKAPPAPVPELPPDQKPEGDNVQWIPGYWGWDEEREDYIWVSGFWRVPPPNRTWVPGHWQKVESGWQWVPGFWGGIEQKLFDYLPPPPALLEIGPSIPAPSANSYFVPGCWVYRDSRYLWRPGCWIDYRPNWVWVPARYVCTPCGCIFVDGYWDYPLCNRGLLFAPVCVRPGVYPTGWCYTPRYAVSVDFLLGALFVRSTSCHYYFGDYFGPRYARFGYTPWFDCRHGRDYCDPLYSYYRLRNDRDWEVGVRALYADRYNGRVAAPPRTLVQQNTVIQNLNGAKNATNLKNMTALAPVAQVAQQNNLPLQAVTQNQRLEEQKSADRLREVARERNRQEAQLVAKASAPAKPTDPPRTVKLDLPPPRPSPASPAVKPPGEATRTEPRKPAPVTKEMPPPPPIKETTPPPVTKPVTPAVKPAPAAIKKETPPLAKPVTPPTKEPTPVKPATPQPQPLPKREAAPQPVKPATAPPRDLTPVKPAPTLQPPPRREVAPAPVKPVTPPARSVAPMPSTPPRSSPPPPARNPGKPASSKPR